LKYFRGKNKWELYCRKRKPVFYDAQGKIKKVISLQGINPVAVTVVLLMLVVGVNIAFGGCSSGSRITVPDDYDTIQEAVNAAEDGDVVEVKPGTYQENVDLQGKKITLTGSDPGDEEVVADTVLEGKGDGPVVTFQECQGSELRGVTVTGGSGKKLEIDKKGRVAGGGVLVTESSATVLSNNIIKDNSTAWGGGVAVYESRETGLKGNTIVGNKANVGGGIAVYNSGDAVLEDNNLEENNGGGGGIAVFESERVEIKENALNKNISDRDGGGVYIYISEEVVVEENTFSGNSAAYNGGGAYVFVSENVIMEENSFSDNKAGQNGGGVLVRGTEQVEVKENTFSENSAEREGGGIWLEGTAGAVVKTNSFTENIAEDKSRIGYRDSEVEK